MTGPAVRYAGNHDHIRDELRRLDLRIKLRTQTLPLLNQLTPADQIDRTAYISPAEVRWLLNRSHDQPARSRDIDATRRELSALSAQIDARVAASRDGGLALALPRLVDVFGLSVFETQALIVCLAPELRMKYDRLYAYLQDDITRKRPSVDLILDLLCDDEDERWTAQRTFTAAGAAQRWQLLHMVPDPHSPSGSSGLAQFLRLDPRIHRFLLGDNEIDVELTSLVRLRHAPGDTRIVDGAAADMLQRALRADGPDVVYLCSPGEADSVALAVQACGEHGLALLVVDGAEMVTFTPDDAARLLRLACREAVLRDGVLFLQRADVLLGGAFGAAARSLRQVSAEAGVRLFLGGEQPWPAGDTFTDTTVQSITVPAPDLHARTVMWRRHLRVPDPAATRWAAELAAQFTIGEHRIRRAVETARQRCAHRRADVSVTLPDLAAACRDQSDLNLGGLAAKVEPHYGWSDLVLPPQQMEQLHEICDQVRNHRLVYDTWGFSTKLGHGTGLNVLFAGPPGTGKTMAAEVVAGAVGLPLFKVDLSGVVSKYIGETEKNLARIFDEARCSNAILLFDEADALFGKRTEVSDAHDRYANIETSYLLQKLDEHRGLVLLASNLRANLDDAFTRRIRSVVEFPFPDADDRARIWRSHIPADTPVADDLDFAMFADEFAVAGGSIKNIVLNAAFLAAADGHRITAEHLTAGTRREFEKLGKLWNEPKRGQAVAR